MSRTYEMQVRIDDYDPARRREIEQAAEAEWPPFKGDWYEYENSIGAAGKGNRVEGETGEEFADGLARAIWKANGEYCGIDVRAIYLEDPPYDYYPYGEEEYAEMMK